MSNTLSLLTLNCWGVHTPLACSDRHERMDAIGKDICKSDYDIVAFQEVWSKSDYKKLVSLMSNDYPHYYYFYSAIIGAGLCIFSKFRIIETFFMKYSVNGFAHKFYHGDYFGGKGVGLAKIAVNGFIINVYITHLHAQYEFRKDGHDEYAYHRLIQAYELAHFIRLTSSECDMVFLAGDLNMRPTDVGYEILKRFGNLYDSWTEQKSEQEGEGMTEGVPENKYCSAKQLLLFPMGLRLDYILFRNNNRTMLECDKCYTCMMDIPGRSFPYSDHYGVAAHFAYKSNITAQAPIVSLSGVKKAVESAYEILDAGMMQVNFRQKLHGFILILLLMLLIFSSTVSKTSSFVCFVHALQYLGAIMCLFSIREITFVCFAHKHVLMNVRNNLNFVHQIAY